MTKEQRQEAAALAVAATFSGWVKYTYYNRTWSSKDCDKSLVIKAIRFEGGTPMECHLLVNTWSSYSSGDRAYGVKPSSSQDSFVAPEKLDVVYSGMFERCVTDDRSQNWYEYSLNGTIITDSVALEMVKDIELRCALNNPTLHTLTAAIQHSPDYTASIVAAIGLEKMVEIMGLQPVSQHTESVYSPAGFTEDPVILYQTPAFGILQVVDTTKRVPVFLTVPPDQTDSREALAWTFGLTYAQYNSLHLQS
jgi:hypothetical protein